MQVSRVIIGTGSFAIGFAIAMHLYSNVFDPLDFLTRSNILAANSFLYGCLEGQKTSLKHKPHDHEVRDCKVMTDELFNKLETLRKDPGHKVNVKE